MNGGSARRKTATCTRQIFRHWVGFEPTFPVFERAKTFHALDDTATVIGHHSIHTCLIILTHDSWWLEISIHEVFQWSQTTEYRLDLHEYIITILWDTSVGVWAWLKGRGVSEFIRSFFLSQRIRYSWLRASYFCGTLRKLRSSTEIRLKLRRKEEYNEKAQ
jgi:hypothetical protein